MKRETTICLSAWIRGIFLTEDVKNRVFLRDSERPAGTAHCKSGVSSAVALPLGVVIVVWLIAVTIGGASAQDGATSGRLGTLASPDSKQQRSRLLAGHVHLLGKTVDQTIEDLQHGRLREFLRSYKQTVDAYNSLTDHVGNASEAIGAASTRLQLARESLGEVGTLTETDPQTRLELSQDVDQLRALLMGQLAVFRAQLDQADERAQQGMLRRMHGIVVRIGQMDGLKRSLQQGGRALMPALAADQLSRRLEEIEEALEIEQQMLGLVANSSRLSVQTLSGQIKRTVLLLQVEASIPRVEIVNLQQTRVEVQGILDHIMTAHQRAANTAAGILTQPVGTDQPFDSEQLLRDVDQLLEQNDGQSPAIDQP